LQRDLVENLEYLKDPILSKIPYKDSRFYRPDDKSVNDFLLMKRLYNRQPKKNVYRDDGQGNFWEDYEKEDRCSRKRFTKGPEPEACSDSDSALPSKKPCR
jgi:hypothetical protein